MVYVTMGRDQNNEILNTCKGTYNRSLISDLSLFVYGIPRFIIAETVKGTYTVEKGVNS